MYSFGVIFSLIFIIYLNYFIMYKDIFRILEQCNPWLNSYKIGAVYSPSTFHIQIQGSWTSQTEKFRMFPFKTPCSANNGLYLQFWNIRLFLSLFYSKGMIFSHISFSYELLTHFIFIRPLHFFISLISHHTVFHHPLLLSSLKLYKPLSKLVKNNPFILKPISTQPY